MNLRRLAALAACSTALLGAGAAGASTVSPARVIDCHRVAGPTIVVSSARNMTCKSAAKDINRYRGSIGKSFKTPGGFRCTRVSGGRLAGQWRCVNGTRAYRFDFSD